jgi:hypothetical protein
MYLKVIIFKEYLLNNQFFHIFLYCIYIYFNNNIYVNFVSRILIE